MCGKIVKISNFLAVCKIYGMGRRTVLLENFTSSSLEQTFDVILMERRSAIWEIRHRVYKIKDNQHQYLRHRAGGLTRRFLP